jgi:hypothetical protein
MQEGIQEAFGRVVDLVTVFAVHFEQGAYDALTAGAAPRDPIRTRHSRGYSGNPTAIHLRYLGIMERKQQAIAEKNRGLPPGSLKRYQD